VAAVQTAQLLAINLPTQVAVVQQEPVEPLVQLVRVVLQAHLAPVVLLEQVDLAEQMAPAAAVAVAEPVAAASK